MSVEINYAYRLTCRFTKLARDQKRREVIARWHVPFARAHENSRLLVCWQRKVPSLILDRVGGWNKRHCCGIAFRTNALITSRRRAIVARSDGVPFPLEKRQRCALASLDPIRPVLKRENRCAKEEEPVCPLRSRDVD